MSVTVAISSSSTITAVDSVAGSSPLSKQLSPASAPVQLLGTAFDEAQGLNIGTSSVVIPLPISPALFVYIKNLSSSQTVTVTWTPNGGASATVTTLGPNEFILRAGNNTLAGTGITALSMIANAVNTPIEYLLGG
jgi:hypothetical protein